MGDQMTYVYVADNMKHADELAYDFFKGNENEVKRAIKKVPIMIEFKNGDLFLFMSEVVFRDWKIGRRNYDTLQNWELKQNN